MVLCNNPRRSIAVCRAIWHFFISVLLWTPENRIHRKFNPSGSKWLYFQYQSNFVLSLITYITVLSHIALFTFAFWLDTDNFGVLQIIGCIFTLWNLVVLCFLVTQQKCFSGIKKGAKCRYGRIYLPLFFSFIGSCVTVVGIWNILINNDNSAISLISVVFLYALILVTFYFQWSTLLSIFATLFYLFCFVLPHNSYFLIDEVR